MAGDDYTEYARAARAAVHERVVGIGHAAAEVLLCVEDPEARTASRQAQVLAKTLATIAADAHEALRQTVIDSIVSGLLTVDEAASLAGASPDEVGHWGILPMYLSGGEHPASSVDVKAPALDLVRPRVAAVPREA